MKRVSYVVYLALNAFRYPCQLVERRFLLIIFIAIVSGSCDQGRQLLYDNKTVEHELGSGLQNIMI